MTDQDTNHYTMSKSPLLLYVILLLDSVPSVGHFICHMHVIDMYHSPHISSIPNTIYTTFDNDSVYTMSTPHLHYFSLRHAFAVSSTLPIPSVLLVKIPLIYGASKNPMLYLLPNFLLWEHILFITHYHHFQIVTMIPPVL